MTRWTEVEPIIPEHDPGQGSGTIVELPIAGDDIETIRRGVFARPGRVSETTPASAGDLSALTTAPHESPHVDFVGRIIDDAFIPVFDSYQTPDLGQVKKQVLTALAPQVLQFFADLGASGARAIILPRGLSAQDLVSTLQASGINYEQSDGALFLNEDTSSQRHDVILTTTEPCTVFSDGIKTAQQLADQNSEFGGIATLRQLCAILLNDVLSGSSLPTDQRYLLSDRFQDESVLVASSNLTGTYPGTGIGYVPNFLGAKKQPKDFQIPGGMELQYYPKAMVTIG